MILHHKNVLQYFCYDNPVIVQNIFVQVSLLYANVSPDDILLKAELDRLAATYPNFKVVGVSITFIIDTKSGFP